MATRSTDGKSLSHVDRQRRRQRIAVYCRTHTAAEACAHFGVSASLVASACRAEAVTPRRAPALQTTNLRLVALLSTTDRSFSSLAEEYGISRQAVHNLASRCRAAGLPIAERP